MSQANRSFRAALALALGLLALSGLASVGPLAEAPAAQVWLPVQPEIGLTWVDDPSQGPQLTAAAAILIENTTGTVLYAHNPHERRAPASTTKVMTAILALEMGNLDDVVTVTRKAAGTPGSSANLYTGQKIRLNDLVHGLLIRSGNDAAVSVGEHIAGSEQAFVDLMNERAKALGAVNTQFQNPHGLDAPGHYSTAYDLAVISRIALLYPTFGDIVKKRTYDSEHGSWSNTNQLLWRFEEVEGIKTGTTSRAGYCLVAAASRGGMQLISVVLGSADRWTDSTKLLEYGFDNFRIVPLAQKGDVLARFPLVGADRPAVAVAHEPVNLLVRSDEVGAVTTQLNFGRRLQAPIRRGETLGTLDVYVGDRLVRQVALKAASHIERRTPFDALTDWVARPFRRSPAAPSQP